MALLFLVFGLVIGSFLNVVILRTQKQESLLGRSHCPFCKKTLGFMELVPILNFLALRGKCRFCATKISWQYPLVEFATALLFLLAFLRFEQGWFLPTGFSSEMFWIFLARDFIALSFLIILFVSDFKYGLLPDRFTLPSIVIFVGMNLWLGMAWPSILFGGVAIGGFFAVQYFLSRGRWIGAGDIRFGVLIGAVVEFAIGIAALFLSYLIGAVFALFLLARRRVGLKTEIPFGTFLAIATTIVLLTDAWFAHWYLSLF